MDAMILAAGLGTRLGTITTDVPKALVPMGGRPLLRWVIDGLVAAGVTRIVINTHHHEGQIRSFVEDLRIPGVTFVLSPEPDGPYETGGGLIAASSLFQTKEPFLLHNADVLSTISMGVLVTQHLAAGAGGDGTLIASLAVQNRESRRALLFDETGLLGWDNRGGEGTEAARHEVREAVGPVRRLAFTGIHVVEPRIFGLTDREGSFSIITLYLELARAGFRIQALDVTEEEWFDVGTPERLEEARLRFSLAAGGPTP
ncbi:MAG: NTP transferase domain-containing protein [Gemmatimonadetes bacterium]|nr:NTP transferase domain-containing protein [Gemmatimonadota bacterium]